MATTFVNLTTDWQQISAVATTIQVASGTILLQSAATQPAVSEVRGHVCGVQILPGIGWGAQTSGEKLYARAVQGTASIVMMPDIG